MSPYNGFPAVQRLRALRWANKRYADGTRQRATICDACGQTAGLLDRHSEDYSEPFGEHIGAFALCVICHLMVHCRFRSRPAWVLYCKAVAMGATFPAMLTRNFGAIRRDYLVGPFPEPVWRELPTRRVLDEIDAGLWRRAHTAAGRLPA